MHLQHCTTMQQYCAGCSYPGSTVLFLPFLCYIICTITARARSAAAGQCGCCSSRQAGRMGCFQFLQLQLQLHRGNHKFLYYTHCVLWPTVSWIFARYLGQLYLAKRWMIDMRFGADINRHIKLYFGYYWPFLNKLKLAKLEQFFFKFQKNQFPHFGY